jgi:catechol 2,3-dioxygenase-like lactoylglutathione lyase family enzyme
MRPEAILESALYVTDLGAAKSFYAGVLGLDQISELDGRHVFFRCGRGVLLLFNAEATRQPPAAGAALPVPPHGTTGAGHLCFAASAEEIARWKAALEASGVPIEADFRWPSGGRSIYFRDPSGNSLEFAEPTIWPLGDER